MLKAQIFVLYTIAIFGAGAIAGWGAHREFIAIQSNPWKLVQTFGISKYY